MLKNVVEINKHKNRDLSQPKHEEYQYLNLLKDIIDEGSMEEGRNGNTKTVIGTAMRFSLENGKIPILTTKKTAWKTCLKELLWFISGSTDNGVLQKQKVKIWDANANNDFKRKQGIWYEDENDLGPIYGHQWRHFNAPYYTSKFNYKGMGVDQLNKVVLDLKNDKYSRRNIMCAWNPCQLNEMALPPCHVLSQFHVVDEDKLICTLYQRSADVGLGLPFNIASYSFLTHILAHHCGLKAAELIHFIGNAHIYEEHVEPLKKQLENEPELYPALRIKEKRENIDDYQVDDFVISGYVSHKKINMKMRA